MCGRYTSTSTVSELAAVFDVEEVRADELPARWNVAPSVAVYAVAVGGHDGGKGPRRMLGTFRWGLVPSWAADPAVGNRMINARAEGIATKPAFRAPFARRRCLIPADAFYEWQRRSPASTAAGGKQPWAFRRRDGRPMALAGIWDVWRDRGDSAAEPLRTCAVVTTAANELMAPVHDRMPVVVEADDWDAWLDPASRPEHLEGLLVPAAAGVLEGWPVSPAVNKVTNDGPQLLDPADGPPVTA